MTTNLGWQVSSKSNNNFSELYCTNTDKKQRNKHNPYNEFVGIIISYIDAKLNKQKCNNWRIVISILQCFYFYLPNFMHIGLLVQRSKVSANRKVGHCLGHSVAYISMSASRSVLLLETALSLWLVLDYGTVCHMTSS